MTIESLHEGIKNLKVPFRPVQLLNVRLGHATNSSSLHSMILVPNAQAIYGDGERGAYGEYGWDHWTASSKESKSHYLAGILYGSLRNYAGENVIQQIMSELIPGVRWFGYDSDENDPAYTWNYIDHQSQFYLPSDWEHKMIDREFFEDLQRFILHDDLLILGGNDNTDGPEDAHHIIREQQEKGISCFDHMSVFDGGITTVARKDPVYGFWTLYTRGSGAKIRFRFDTVANPESDMETQEHYSRGHIKTGLWKDHRSSLPELVDLKITDYCTKGCEYCYQWSSPQNPHADTDHVFDVINALSARKVFEVAIGGGEPTEHPEFWEILRYCASKGVTPNFSTKRLKWMQEDNIEELRKPVGGFAYSVRTGAEASAFVRMYKKRNIKKGSFQYVLGSSPMEEFEAILRIAGEEKIRVTILGYKRVGLGATVEPQDYSAWIDVLMKVWDFKQFDEIRHFENRSDLRFFSDYEAGMCVSVADADRIMTFSEESTTKDGGNVHGPVKPINLSDGDPGRWLYTWSNLGRDSVDVKVGIDTSVAAEFHEQIKGALQVPDWLYDVKEGLHSFYVDCVRQLLGPSSYGEYKGQYRNHEELNYILDRIDLWEERKLKLGENAPAQRQWQEESEEALF